MKILVIVGPTRTGKTERALFLAKKFSGEIISADSRQVYVGMDIGTGKSVKREAVKGKGKWTVENIPIYLYDVERPDEHFSVSRYYDLASKTLEEIWQRKKLPILVGGTGFYIKAILDGIGTLGISPDWQLRSELGNFTTLELYKKLFRLDPKKAKSLNPSDKKNPRRLVRAIEVALSDKKQEASKKKIRDMRFAINSLIVGLSSDRKILYQKADRWIEEILQKGLVNEVRTLLKNGYKDTIPMQGIIYKSIVDFIEGKLILGNLTEKLKNEMHGYIRRQMTWFKKDKRIIWFDIQKSDYQKKIENLVQTWLNE